MSEEILPGLYRIKVPLPGSPLKATNSYVMKGTERSLIIDTGWNREDCMRALVSGLKKCGVDLRQADFFITEEEGKVAREMQEQGIVFFTEVSNA